MMRMASVVCGLLAVGLLGYASYRHAVDGEPPGPAIVIHEPNRDLGTQPCEAVVPVSFRIANVSSQSVRVLGLAPG